MWISPCCSLCRQGYRNVLARKVRGNPRPVRHASGRPCLPGESRPLSWAQPWPRARNIRGLLSLSLSLDVNQGTGADRCHPDHSRSQFIIVLTRSVTITIHVCNVCGKLKQIKKILTILWSSDCMTSITYDAHTYVCDQSGDDRKAWQCFAFTEHRNSGYFPGHQQASLLFYEYKYRKQERIVVIKSNDHIHLIWAIILI